MVASMVMSGQYKYFRRRNVGIFSSAFAGYATKQWMTKPDHLFSSTSSSSSSSFSSSSSSLPSSSFPTSPTSSSLLSFSVKKGCLCRSLISHSFSNLHGSQHSTGSLTKQPALRPPLVLLQPRRSFHTSCMNSFNHEKFPWKDQGIAIQHSMPYMLALMHLRMFTSVEFEEADFIEGSPEAFLYLMSNLQVGNMKDLEDIVTEQGNEACRQLCDDLAGSEDLLVVKDDVIFLKLCRMTYVTKDSENPLSNDRLEVEAIFWCVDHKAYERRDVENEKMEKEGRFDPFSIYPIQPKREFLVNFLVYLNEQKMQSSEWFIDNVHFKRLGPRERKK